MEAKELAKQMEHAYVIHEDSYRNRKGEKYNSELHKDLLDSSYEDGRLYSRDFCYRKSWELCCREAGMAKAWVSLLAPYMSLGYCDTWEWVEEQLKKESE